MSNVSLKIFVAMPGTNMGSTARWQNPDRIKARFFEVIGKRLAERLLCEIDLVVEKDRKKSGVIYTSMFNAALESDIYIADITGNNPNVYLELGVRWGLKDGVTIVVRQEEGSAQFNVAANRIFHYSDDPDVLEHAIESIVSAIEVGLQSKEIDSPVRQNVENVPKYSEKDISDLKERSAQLADENKHLRSLQGRDYLISGEASDDPEYRLSMFRKAVEINPNLIDAYFNMGVELQKLGQYEEAVTAFQRAILLKPESAQTHCQLGLTYSKMGSLEQAAISLHEAVRLDAKDAEAQSILGGVLRKLGMQQPMKNSNWNILHEAKNSYVVAFELDNHNTYALGNIARLNLILSKIDPTLRANAMKDLEMLRHLSLFKLVQHPDDYWLKFDLADTYLLSGEVDEGYQRYLMAIKSVPRDYQASVFSSVISPLEEFLFLNVVDDPIQAIIQKILEDFKSVLSRSR